MEHARQRRKKHVFGVKTQKQDRRKISITFDEDVFDAVNSSAYDQGVSFSCVANRFMKMFLIQRGILKEKSEQTP